MASYSLNNEHCLHPVISSHKTVQQKCPSDRHQSNRKKSLQNQQKTNALKKHRKQTAKKKQMRASEKR